MALAEGSGVGQLPAIVRPPSPTLDSVSTPFVIDPGCWDFGGTKVICKRIHNPPKEIMNHPAVLARLGDNAPSPLDVIMNCVCTTLERSPKGVFTAGDFVEDPTDVNADPLSLLKAYYYALGGLCTLAKPLTPNNGPYLAKRFRAMCATAGITAILPDANMTHANTLLICWQNDLSADPITKKTLVEAAIKSNPQHPTSKAILSQVRMVYQYNKMAAIKCMYEFCTKKPSAAILYGSVINECVPFKTIYTHISTAIGPTSWPYAGVRELPELDHLSHNKFPNLYHAAVLTKQANGEFTSSFVVSTSAKTEISKSRLKLSAAKPL